MSTQIMVTLHGERVCLSKYEAARKIEKQAAVIGDLLGALGFYAEVGKYPAPLTGGMGALWDDCGQIARAALSQAQEPDNQPTQGERV